MISRDVKQGDVQKGYEVFEIVVRQVSASEYHFKILKMPACTKAVKALNHLITDYQDFHNVVFSPRKMFRARCTQVHKSTATLYEIEMLAGCRQLSNQELQTIIQ